MLKIALLMLRLRDPILFSFGTNDTPLEFSSHHNPIYLFTLLASHNLFLSISEFFPYPLTQSNTVSLNNPGPFKIKGWMELLSHYLDKAYMHILLKIIHSGIKVGYTGPPQKILEPNLPTANNAPDILTQDLDKQIAHNRVTKPDAIPDAYISSLLRLKPKSDGGWQQIHHLSYLRGSSVNCHILRNFGTLEYTNIDDTIAVLLSLDKRTKMVKRNLSDAFRHVLIAPSNWLLLSFFWDNAY